MKPTFKQQYDKIVGAYLRNELDPHNGCACFVGNLLNKNREWEKIRVPYAGSHYLDTHFKSRLVPERQNYMIGEACVKSLSNNLYSAEDVRQLEQNFLQIFNKNMDEESLFSAMESTLLMLRQMHESKGETVEDYIFEKRVLIEQ